MRLIVERRERESEREREEENKEEEEERDREREREKVIKTIPLARSKSMLDDLEIIYFDAVSENAQSSGNGQEPDKTRQFISSKEIDRKGIETPSPSPSLFPSSYPQRPRTSSLLSTGSTSHVSECGSESERVDADVLIEVDVEEKERKRILEIRCQDLFTVVGLNHVCISSLSLSPFVYFFFYFFLFLSCFSPSSMFPPSLSHSILSNPSSLSPPSSLSLSLPLSLTLSLYIHIDLHVVGRCGRVCHAHCTRNDSEDILSVQADEARLVFLSLLLFSLSSLSSSPPLSLSLFLPPPLSLFTPLPSLSLHSPPISLYPPPISHLPC